MSEEFNITFGNYYYDKIRFFRERRSFHESLLEINKILDGLK